MEPAPSRIPPFSGLLAFEATLRHGSMTLAGDELGLTQSAVSHRIRALEDFFGVALLERLNPGLRATEAGTRLGREVAPMLGTLAGMRRRIASPSGPRPFRLGLSAPLLALWLSPRLPALAEAFPDLSIEIQTWETAAEASRAEADLSLVWRSRADPDIGASELAFPSEAVFPVTSPALVRTLRPGSDWQSLPVLAKGRRGEETGREWSWATWLRNAPAREWMRFRDVGSSLRAAIDGNGVALGRSLLVADALRRQGLVRLAGPDVSHACTKAQFARWRDPRDGTAERMAVRLVSLAEEDIRAVEGVAAGVV